MNGPGYAAYQALAHAFYAAATPYFLFRMARRSKYRAGLRERLGSVPAWMRRLPERPLWIHAVSAGETRSIEPLTAALYAARPGLPLAISTVTDTGQELARQLPHVAGAFYLPIELFWAQRPIFRALGPRALVLVETELWPALLYEALSRQIPVMLVNGRLSDRSWPRYRRMRRFFAPFLARFSLVVAQSEEERERFCSLGARPEHTAVLPCTKYDAVPPPSPEQRDAWRRRLQLGDGERLVVAGSTFPGEEALMLSAMAGRPALLVLVPRHPERTGEAEAAVHAAGRTPRLWSKWEEQSWQGDDVLVVDRMGVLRDLYTAADVAVIGKSLLAEGGQNPIEPASQGVATLIGPHMQNFREATELLLSAGGALQISGPDELASALGGLLESPEARREIGERGLAALAARRGASRKIAERMLEVLDGAAHGDA